MRELWFWRGVAAVACAGWLTTALWGATPPEAEAPLRADAGAARAADAAPTVADRSARREALQERLRAVRNAAPAPDGDVDEAALELARAEVRAEMQARHEAHAEERLARILDRTTAFAEQNGLDDPTLQALSDAVLANHARMRELRPEFGPGFGPGGDGPPDAQREQMQASFDQLDADLREVLGDELAEEFRATMRPERGPPR